VGIDNTQGGSHRPVTYAAGDDASRVREKRSLTCEGREKRSIVDELVRRAEQEGCYKVILDCDESNVAFYAKCGLKIKGVQMAKYRE